MKTPGRRNNKMFTCTYVRIMKLLVEDGKNLPAKQETKVQIPGSGRSPAEGNGNPRHYSCWENPMNRGAWWAVVCVGHKESNTLSDSHFHFSWRNYR